MAWRRLEDPRFGLANRISDEIAALEWREPGSLLDVRESKEFLLACDFAGAHAEARYESFAFLLGAIGQTARGWRRAAKFATNSLREGGDVLQGSQ